MRIGFGFVFLFFVAAGCGSKTGEETGNDLPDDTGPQIEDTGTDLVDEDNDGFYTDEDCDDNNYQTYPGADEICDGLDNDCDKEIDEDFDIDGDGQTDQDVCDAGTDCDDTDSSVYAGADEVPYDGVDQDCDGTDLTDVDADGYDAEEVGGDDCDDTDPAISPGAEDEPKDGIDQDCDGLDNLDSDGDGYDDEDYGGDDCDDADAAIHPGLFDFRTDDIDQDCDGDTSTSHEVADASTSIIGDGIYSALVGYGLAACDFDGDGLDDLVIGAPFGAEYSGQVGIWYGSGADGWTAEMTMDDADTLIEGNGYAFIGFETACTDLDGDGFEDLLFERGEIHYTSGTTVYDTDLGVLVYYGDGNEFGAFLDDGDADAELSFAMDIDESGTVRALAFEAGDMDGDGASEIVFLVDELGMGGLSDSVVSFVIPGGTYSGASDMTESIAGYLTSDQPWALNSLWAFGDIDGDGASDLFVGEGAYSLDLDTADTADTADPYTIEGRSSFITDWGVFLGTDVADAAIRSYFGQAGDYFGFSAASGDFDGDGAQDVAIAAIGSGAGDTDWGGAFYLVSDISGFIGQDELDFASDYQALIWGEDDSGYLGWSIVGTSDFDGDGIDELVVSAPNGGSSDVGEVWLLSGALISGESRVDDVALVRFLGENNDNQFSTQMLGHADFDGDGVSDLVFNSIGWDSADDASIFQGRVTLYLSSQWMP